MFREALWNSPVGKSLDPVIEKQKYIEKISQIVQRFLNDVTQIQNTLKSGSEKCYFLKCVDVSGYANAFEEKYEKEGVLRHYLTLGSLLSNVLELPNSIEKLVITWKMLSDYHEFIEKGKNQREKFLISDIGRISLNPPATKLKISIVENTQTMGTFADNINSLLDFGGIMQKLSKKAVKINENRYTFQEKKIFMEHLSNFYKAYSVPSKMSYSVIVISTCEILTLIYSMLSEDAFSNRECFDIIEQIHYLVYMSFMKNILGDLHQLSVIVANKEFEVLEKSLEVNLGKNKTGPPSLAAFL